MKYLSIIFAKKDSNYFTKLIEMQRISRILTDWYDNNKRELPWRQTSNPYKIWISEIILQQTRVAQGMNYYLRFTSVFPDIKSLAEAKEEQVLKLWQGLGYYSRARNLHAAAKQVLYKYNGIMPKSYAELLQLKGVGDYTAAAIASIAYNEPVATVDGNVYRVLARLFGISEPVGSTSGFKLVKMKANEILDKGQPSVHNQALMEFGALHCKPANPDCENCPLMKNCVAYQTGKVTELPVKKANTKVRNRYFNYLIILKDDKTYLQKRTGDDIWRNLYEFPLIETPKRMSVQDIQKADDWNELLKKTAYTVINISKMIVHKLSHQHINGQFIILRLDSGEFKNDASIEIRQKDFGQYPVPRLIEKFIEESYFL